MKIKHLREIIKQKLVENEETAFLTTNNGEQKAISFKDRKELDTLKKNSDIKKIETGKGQNIKEMAAPQVVNYSLKVDYKDLLPNLLKKIEKSDKPGKTPISGVNRVLPPKIVIHQNIAKKIVEILEKAPKEGLSQKAIFEKLKEIYKDEPDYLSTLKNPQNVKYYLWGGMTSNEWNEKFRGKINDETNQPWEDGDLTPVLTSPFVRTKHRRLTSYQQGQKALDQLSPEDRKAKEDSFKTITNLREKVLEFKELLSRYDAEQRRVRADFKIDKTKKTETTERLEKQMLDMLDVETAVAVLHQWEAGFIPNVPAILYNFAKENNLMTSKTDKGGLTDIYKSVLNDLISSKKISKLNEEKEFRRTIIEILKK